MIKLLLITLLSSLVIAEDFAQFLQKAQVNSPYLKSSALVVTQAQESGSLLTRYANPSLELEYSAFDSDISDTQSGYRVNVSQPIRLWSVGDDKDVLAKSIKQRASASYQKNRATFTRDISLLYTQYAQSKALLILGDDELEIAYDIYKISKERYKLGTISRGIMLQAKVAYEMIQIANETLVLRSQQTYFKLLRFAGVNEQIDLDTGYHFEIQSVTHLENPGINLLNTQAQASLNQAKVDTHAVEWVNLVGEYEKEPDQDIMRIGLNIPLAVFNTKSQEHTIANLETSRTQLLVSDETTKLHIDTLRLQKERISLEKLQTKNIMILSTELELLAMFEEGYKIANVNLLELQDIKNKVISTKESLIQIKTALDQNAITTNYNQGTYNE